MMHRKAYVDIEATYKGKYDINNDRERNICFKDFPNWKFFCETEYKGKKVQYKGIIGILILDFDIDEQTQVHKLLDKRFIQLIGPEITKERLMKELEGMNEVIGYHCRTKPNHKGRIGYDFGIIAAQLGVVLDDLPGVKCTDLEILCHNAEMYGGLKGVEELIPTIPPRKSNIADGHEADLILLDIAACDDNTKRRELWKKALLYNKEDVKNMVYIEHWLRNLKIIE